MKSDSLENQFREIGDLNDSIYWVYISYHGKATIDSLESTKFSIERKSNYLKRYEIPTNSRKFIVIDSIRLNKMDILIKNRIISQRLKELDHIYWDSLSDGKVRQLMFYNDSKEIIKKIRIVGEPKNIPESLFDDVEHLIEIGRKGYQEVH